MAYGIPDYADPGTGGYAPQARPQQQNPLLMSLMKGLVMGQTRQGNQSLMVQALRRIGAKPGGSGITAPTPEVGGTGITSTAQTAGAGADIAGAPSLDAAGAGIFGGTGNAALRATDTGFGDTGMGGGISTGAQDGPGLSMGQGTQGIEYSPGIDGGTGTATSGGAEVGGGNYATAATGAYAGANAGVHNYYNDPNMRNGKDGFGKHHADYRATIGGGTVGGLMGYYGGALGAAAAPTVVEAIHPTMESLTRTMINTGDKLGDSAGAMVADPIGTMASGKYSNEELAMDKVKYSLLGGLAKFV